MSSDTIQIILVMALALVTTVAVVVFWQWWREADSAKRRAVVREAARWAVLTRQAEKAVHTLNTNRAAADMAHLNGKGPRHDNDQ